MSGLSRDGQDNSGNNNELESYQNKKDSEKKRREQENFYIEELAMLISAQLPEFSDSDDSSGGPNDLSRLEKGSILQETVDKLKKLKQTRRKDIQKEEVSSSRSFLPKEILGSLVLEALDGFMFITSNEGSIDFVSDNVLDYLGFRQEDFLAQKIIFNFIHHGDHARFRVNLEPETWKTWKKLPQNTGGRQGFDRSKVFNLRFKINNEPKVESLEERQQRLDQYENMQVSAIAMSNPIENNQGEPKSGLFCIARRISRNERSGLTPVEQFTTRCHRRSLEIQTIDTEGLPQLYKTIISSHLHGKNLVELVHPQDRPLMKEHVEGFYKNVTDTSRVYRMILPSPMNTIHVKTKTKDFRPQPGHTHPGYIMSTHSIIRDHELQMEDLPALRPELQGASETESRPGQGSPLVQTLQSGAGSSLSPGARPLPRPASRSPGQPGPASSPRLFSPGPGTESRSEMLEALLSPPPPVSPQQIGRHMGRLTPGASNGGGNELLKELLRPKENEQKSDGLCFKSSVPKPEETITIGQILNERPNDGRDRMETSELLKQLRKPPESVGRISHSELAQLLQKGPSASSMPIHPDLKRPSSSESEGPASKQVPSLEKLLSVRPTNQTIPPPVPRKWSERPQEKLPRDLIDKINKDAQSRNNNSQPRSTNARSPVSGVRGSTPLGHQQPQRTIIRNVVKSPATGGAGMGESNSNLIPPSMSDYPVFPDAAASEFNDLLTDPVFSKILDGVDLGDDNIDPAICDQNLAKQKILEIEQSLKLVEHSFSPTSHAQSVVTSALGGPGGGQTSVLTSSSSSVMVVSSYQQQQQQFSSVIQSGQPQHRILQQRNAGPPVTFQSLAPGPRSPASLGTNMEELLKGIPPNVSIPTSADQQQGGSAVRMSTLERQLTSPGMAGPSRHLSGDQGVTFRGQPDPRRHLSGDQVNQVLSAGGQGPGRRPSGDTGAAITRFGPGEQPGHFSLDQGPGNGHQAIIRTQAGGQHQVQRSGRVQGPPVSQVLGRAPGGRTLSQEDLESFGLSIEVSSDFGLSPAPGQQQAGPAPQPQFPLKSPVVSQFQGPVLQFTSPGLPEVKQPPLKSPGPMFSGQAGLRQFVSVSLPQQPEPPQHQFITSSQFSPVTSVAQAVQGTGPPFPGQPHPATPPSSQFSSQFSPPGPPATINSKASFPF